MPAELSTPQVAPFAVTRHWSSQLDDQATTAQSLLGPPATFKDNPGPAYIWRSDERDRNIGALHLRKTRLHLDATRSSALFAERLLLVEGVTDAAVARELGWVWAADDEDKQSFVDALSIVPMGTKIGSWPVRLLATRGYELCSRLAVLRDSDLELSETPQPPAWAADHDPSVLFVEHCHPTLEPAIATDNGELVARAIQDIGLPMPDPLTPESVHLLFRSARRPEGDRPGSAAGPGSSRKGEFALALAGRLRSARDMGEAVIVPSPFAHVFDFLYSLPGVSEAATTDPDTPGDDGEESQSEARGSVDAERAFE